MARPRSRLALTANKTSLTGTKPTDDEIKKTKNSLGRLHASIGIITGAIIVLFADIMEKGEIDDDSERGRYIAGADDGTWCYGRH